MSQYQITINSTAADKAEASRQLAAAKAEWNAFLESRRKTINISGIPTVVYDSGDPAVGWAQVAEPKLAEILQRYPYVGADVQARLVSDTLAIRGDGTYNTPGISTLTDTAPSEIPNSDDAYVLSKGNTGSTQLGTTGASINRTSNLIGPGSGAGDTPDLVTAESRPVTLPQGARILPRDDRAPLSDYAYPSQENSIPVTRGPSSELDTPYNAATSPPPGAISSPPTSVASSAPPRQNPPSAASDDVGSIVGTPSGSANSGSNSSQVSFVKVPQAGRANQTEMPSRIKVRENILHRYANWTYKIGWYMLDIPTYNDFVTSGRDSGAALRSRPLCVSGGSKKTGTGIRNDLYIKSLRCNGVIGNNKASPNANLFEIEMQVVEPYSVSLLADLKRLADEMGDSQQHLAIPYLLEISFVSYDDKGAPISNIREIKPKLIPVTIINITFNINSAGTVYNITMVPCGQTALNVQHGVIRNNVRVYGNTLKEMIVDGQFSLAKALKDEEEALKAQNHCEYVDEYSFVIKSFNGETANNDLLKSPVTFPIGGDNGGSQATPIHQRSMREDKPTAQYFPIPGGSNIKDILQRIAIMTKYFQDLVKPDKPNSQENVPQVLIKVIPLVKYGPFDRIRQRYQRKTTYKITTYFKYGQDNPNTGQASADQGVIAKEYNWLFTGKNQDILDLDLQYNLQYFRIFEKSSPSKSDAETSTVTKDIKKAAKTNLTPAQTTVNIANETGEASATTLRGANDAAVQEYFDQQLNSTDNADLITLDLSIIGDPDWIPQDLSVRPEGDAIRIRRDGFENGSIITDVEAVHAALRFKTPRDYSDTTGLMELTTNQTQIEGVYQVITVESNFESGRFTQRLSMTRLPKQKENKPRNELDSPSERGFPTQPNQRQAAGLDTRTTRATSSPFVSISNNNTTAED